MEQLGIEFLLKGNAEQFLKDVQKAKDRADQIVENKPLELFAGKTDTTKLANKVRAAANAAYSAEVSVAKKWWRQADQEFARSEKEKTKELQKQSAERIRIAKAEMDEIERVHRKKIQAMLNHTRTRKAQEHVNAVVGPNSGYAQSKEQKRRDDAKYAGLERAGRREKINAHLEKYVRGPRRDTGTAKDILEAAAATEKQRKAIEKMVGAKMKYLTILRLEREAVKKRGEDRAQLDAAAAVEKHNKAIEKMVGAKMKYLKILALEREALERRNAAEAKANAQASESARANKSREDGARKVWRDALEEIRQRKAREHLSDHVFVRPRGEYGPFQDPGELRRRRAQDQRDRTRRGAATGRLNSNIFQAQQLIEDFSYAGFRGASNNAAFLLSQLTGPYGLAAMAGLTAVNIGVMAYESGMFSGEAETAAEKASKLADALNAIAEARENVRKSVAGGVLESGRSYEDMLYTGDGSAASALFSGAKGSKRKQIEAAGAAAIRNSTSAERSRLSRYLPGGVDEEALSNDVRISKQEQARDSQRLNQLQKIKKIEAEITRAKAFRPSGTTSEMGEESARNTAKLKEAERQRAIERRKYLALLGPEDSALAGDNFIVGDQEKIIRDRMDKRSPEVSAAAARARAAREEFDKKASDVFKNLLVKAESGDKSAQAELDKLIEKYPELGRIVKEVKESQQEYTKAAEKHLDVSRDAISLAKQEANAIENKIEAQQREAKEAIKNATSSRGSFVGRGFDIIRSRSRDFMEQAGAPEWMIRRREAALLERQGGMLYGQSQAAGAAGDTERQVELLKELQSLQMGVASTDPSRGRAEAAFAASIRTQQMIEQAYARQKAMAESSVVSLNGNLTSLNAQIMRFEESVAGAGTLSKLDPTTPEAVAKMQELNRQIALTLAMLGASGGKLAIPSLPAGVPPVKKAAGGHIRGPGSGTSDSIPAMLSNGEYVLKASAVKSLGVPFLNSLNGYAKGGPVRSGGWSWDTHKEGPLDRVSKLRSAYRIAQDKIYENKYGPDLSLMERVDSLRASEARLYRIKQMRILQKQEYAHKARMKSIRSNRYGGMYSSFKPDLGVSLGSDMPFPASSGVSSSGVSTGSQDVYNPIGLRARRLEEARKRSSGLKGIRQRRLDEARERANRAVSASVDDNRSMPHSKWAYNKDGAWDFSGNRLYPDSNDPSGWSTMDGIRARAGMGGNRMSAFMKVGNARARKDIPLTMRQQSYASYQNNLAAIRHQRVMQMSQRRVNRHMGRAQARQGFGSLAGRQARSYFGRRRGFAAGGLVSVHAGIAIGGGVNALGEGYDLMGYLNNPYYNPNFYSDGNAGAFADQANRLQRTGLNSAYGGLTDFTGAYSNSYGKFSDGSNRSRYSGGFGGSMYSGGFSSATRKYARGGIVRPVQSYSGGGSVSNNNYSTHAGQIVIKVGSVAEGQQALGGVIGGEYNRRGRRG